MDDFHTDAEKLALIAEGVRAWCRAYPDEHTETNGGRLAAGIWLALGYDDVEELWPGDGLADEQQSAEQEG